MQYEKEIEEINQCSGIDEVVRYVEEKLRSCSEIDGGMFLLQQEEKDYMINRDETVELEEVPKSLLQEVLEKKEVVVIDEPMKKSAYVEAVDNPDHLKLSSLLFVPLESDDGVYGVLKLWKTVETDKEQVVMPLITGGKVMGMSTRSKRTLIHKSFEEEEVEQIVEYQPLLEAALVKIASILETQEEDALNTLMQHAVLNSPEEASAYLFSQISSLKAPVNNLLFLHQKLLKSVHKDDRVYPDILSAATLVEQINQRLHRAVGSLDKEMVHRLVDDMQAIESETYFVSFHQGIVSKTCEKLLKYGFFLDPTLPAEINIPEKQLSAFLPLLLNLTIEDAERSQKFDFRIQRDENSDRMKIVISYKKPHMDNEILNIYQELFKNPSKEDVASEELFFAYKKLQHTGGKIALSYDRDILTYTVTVPYEHISDKALIPALSTQHTSKICLLLDTKEEMDAANNIARYILRMGIQRSQLVATTDHTLIPKDVTHLMIFESQFDDILDGNTLNAFEGKVLLVTKGCQSDGVSLADFSLVDASIEADQYYLHELYEFLALEVI